MESHNPQNRIVIMQSTIIHIYLHFLPFIKFIRIVSAKYIADEIPKLHFLQF